tara:strand:- start:149 stop:499 length:351 start_codon:yes stop_codon:yes gene_type:complete
MNILDWIKNKFRKKTLTNVFQNQPNKQNNVTPSQLFSTSEPILEEVTKPPLTEFLYGYINDRRTKVYHILKKVDGVPDLYKSICHILTLDTDFDIVGVKPTNKRLCKRCNHIITQD